MKFLKIPEVGLGWEWAGKGLLWDLMGFNGLLMGSDGL
jgi:hypothetical protein